MPNEWLLLEVSNGAKVLLAHFCSAANNAGESWYSYEQLKVIVGRSKASVCNYVAELREAGVLQTKEQKMANGFNYRLKMSIVGWKSILEAWKNGARAKKSGQKKAERSVQQAERNDPSGHKTNTYKTNNQPDRFAAAAVAAIEKHLPPVAPVEWSIEDEKAWHDFRPVHSDPYTEYNTLPSQSLVEKLSSFRKYLMEKHKILDARPKIDAIAQAMSHFMKRNRVTATPEAENAFIDELSKHVRTTPQIDTFFYELQKAWLPSWKLLSTPNQVSELAQSPTVTAQRAPGDVVHKVDQFAGRLNAWEGAKRNERAEAQRKSRVSHYANNAV